MLTLPITEASEARRLACHQLGWFPSADDDIDSWRRTEYITSSCMLSLT